MNNSENKISENFINKFNNKNINLMKFNSIEQNENELQNILTKKKYSIKHKKFFKH